MKLYVLFISFFIVMTTLSCSDSNGSKEEEDKKDTDVVVDDSKDDDDGVVDEKDDEDVGGLDVDIKEDADKDVVTDQCKENECDIEGKCVADGAADALNLCRECNVEKDRLSWSLREADSVCRASTGSCDPAEVCDGTSSGCPDDKFLEDLTPCDDQKRCEEGVCEGRRWHTAHFVQQEFGGCVYDPHFAMNGSGDAIVVWEQFAGSNGSVFAANYDLKTGWHEGTLMEQYDEGDTFAPQIGIDGDGNAIAVWGQDIGQIDNIWANRYVVGVGWQDPEPIEEIAESTGKPKFAMNGSGSAIATWTTGGYFDGKLWANRHSADSGWVGHELIADSGGVGDHRIAIDKNGNSITVWSQSATSEIWARKFNVQTGWEDSELIAEYTGTVSHIDIAMSSEGDAMVVWDHDDDAKVTVWAKSYETGTGWSIAESISSGSDVEVAMDNQGTAIAVIGGDSIWTSIHDGESGWLAAEKFDDIDSERERRPHVAMDDNGNGIVVWTKRGTESQDVWVNSYKVDVGWKGPEPIAESVGYASYPRVAMDDNGNAVVVWLNSESGFCDNIWANEFY